MTLGALTGMVMKPLGVGAVVVAEALAGGATVVGRLVAATGDSVAFIWISV